jgi:two-component system chemotaxis sensor kinase CheA
MRDERGAPTRGSLQRKLLRTVLGVVLLVGIGTLSVVSYSSARTSSKNLDVISGHIEAQLDAKGRGLAESHALALKGLIQDNAFSDIEALIARTVDEDPDILYGLLTDAEGRKLAFAARGTPKADAKDRAPWVAIGLPEAMPKVTERTVRRLRAKSNEVVEAATPVMLDREVAGTLRYGISTKRMQDALATARAGAHADLLWTQFSLCGLVALVGAACVFLGRREAARIVRPLGALTAAARSLAAGDREVRVGIRSGDELELLGDSFDQMAQDLATSYRVLEDLNQGLEQKVQERTAEVGARNRDMRLVLDNVAQGLVTIDAAGVMAAERSAVVEKWFGPVPEGASLADYLEARSTNFVDHLRVGLEQLQEGLLPRDLCVQQLPTSLTTGGREYRLTYTAIGDDDPIRNLLVVIEDITEAVALQREERAQREVLRAVQHVTQDRSGFLTFRGEAARLLEQIRSGTDFDEVRRAIHSLKGSAALLDLQVVAGICHRMEDRMAELRDLPARADVEALDHHWGELMDALEPFSGAADRAMVEVPRLELDELLTQLRQPNGVQNAQRLIASWELEPIAKPLQRLADQAKGLAVMLGRGAVTCAVEFDQTRLAPDVWAPFWAAMSHVVRNAVDHGLETPEERAAKQKGEGHLVFRATTKGLETTISLSDDGRGIDWEALRAKAIAAKLPAATRVDLVNAMLTDGISTRKERTTTSGRGVGMAAVKKIVQRMGGTLSVESAPDKGTSWTFTMPSNPNPKNGAPKRPVVATT